MLFINTTNPSLQIYNPASGEFARFVGGRLEISESDPNFGVVMAEAKRNALISIHEKATTCPECGDLFTGGAAAADLGKHRKNIHFDKWLADKDAKDAVARDLEIKRRAGYVCDICSPVQEFGTAEDLAAHTTKLHANAPELTESGETKGEAGGGAEVDADIPAATTSSS